MNTAQNPAYLHHLEGTGFRNFVYVDVRVERPWVGVVGRNGAGKTNLLEAIHVLCRQRGFRDEPPAKLVRWGSSSLSLAGRFAAGHDRGLTWDAQRGTQRFADGDVVDNARHWAITEPIFGYRPDDDLFFHDEPKQRRKYLDWFCAYGDAEYMTVVAAYERALRQRNALLRSGGGAAEWAAWDGELAEWGARLTLYRKAAASRLAAAYAELWSQHQRVARLEYRSCGSDDAAAAFARLEATRAADRERGWTWFGPHRDDVVILLDERPVRDAGSQGYRKLAVLLLALACATATPATRLFYLDDFEGELDADNEAFVYTLLRALPYQVWLSGVRRPAPLAHDPGIEWIELTQAPTAVLRYPG